MFISDKLVFVELQKTGSTHIRQVLAQCVGGRIDGKHNVPAEELLSSGIPFLGSIRNPWNWYVSLWTYGCQKKGLLYQRLTQPSRWQMLDERRAYQPKAKRVAPPEGASAERATTFWYADPVNVQAFREWVQVVSAPGCRRIVEPGFGASPISKAAGLMTFRYFRLFVRGAHKLEPEYKSLEMLQKLDTERCFIHRFIRTENLEDDLLDAIAACGVKLTEQQVAEVTSARKTNTSARPLSASDYYDEETAGLVGIKEKFIIDKFSYESPV